MKPTKSNFVSGSFTKGATLELKNARFVDIVNGRYFKEGLRVIVRDHKIAAMPFPGEVSEEIQPDLSIDLSGKTVLPGLFNVHCHIQMINPTIFSTLRTVKDRKVYHDSQVEKNMADCLACGITNIRDAYSDDLEPNRNLCERISKGDIYGPRIQKAVVVGATGGYLTPEPKGLKRSLLKTIGLGSFEYHHPSSGVVVFPGDASERQVRDAVDRAVEERGADLIKVGESLEESLLNANPRVMSLNQLSAISDQARRHGLQSTIHSVSLSTFNRALKAGFSSIAHMPRNGLLTSEDIKNCLDSEAMIEPTLSVGYDLSWKLPGNDFANDPHMDMLYRFRDETYHDLASGFWLPELRRHVIDGYDKAARGQYRMLGLINMSKLLQHFSPLIHFGINNTRALLQAGASMSCGNDGGIQACTPAMIQHELSIFNLFMNRDEEKLFDNVSALQTATINSAISMGLEKRFGSLEVGKTADLVVIEGDPLQDISVIGKPVDALFMDGNLVIDNCGLTP